MIPTCPAPLPPSKPKTAPPPNACDCHNHVFGPASRFPYAEDRSYTPPDAPVEKYLAMLDTVGFARGALVQASAHGSDNSAMLDALGSHPDRLRGIAVADESVPVAELKRWHSLGVRGLRFNHYFRGGQLHYRGGVPLTAADYATIARFHQAFIGKGLELQFQTHGRPIQSYNPTLRDLLTEHDRTGRQRSFLASEDDYQFVRSLERAGIAPAGSEARPVEGRPAIPGMEAEEAQHAQAVLGDALVGIADEAHPSGREIGAAAERIVERAVEIGVQRVEGEVATACILQPVVGEGDDRTAAVGLDVAAQRRQLVVRGAGDARHGAMLQPGRDHLDAGGFQRARHRVGRLVDGEIDVVDPAIEHGIAHAAADEARDDARRLERGEQPDGRSIAQALGRLDAAGGFHPGILVADPLMSGAVRPRPDSG